MDFDKIIERIKSPKNTALIDRAVEITKKHALHIYGEGVNDFISKIEGFESESQEIIRKKYTGTPTVPIYSTVLNPLEKIFSARDGSKYYDFENEDTEILFEEKLTNVGDGMSINDWMCTVWKDKVNTNSTGLAFIEISKAGEPYITFKSIVDIYDIDFVGIDVSFVIFNPIIKDGNLFYRVVDNEYDYLIKRNGGEFSIVEEETFKNWFNTCPAVIFSSKKDDLTEAKTSYVAGSITIADDYLTDASIHKLYKKKHGFPVFAMRSSACGHCDNGFMENGDECIICKGTGKTLKKDVSDTLEVPVPEQDGQFDPMSPIAVYVHAPTEISVEQRAILTELKSDINFAVWGVNDIDRDKNIKTATGEVLNVQPKIDKLDAISKNAELVESKLTNFLGYYYYPNEYKGCLISYGRNYILRNENDAWKIYSEARTTGASISVLNALYEDFLRVKYNKNIFVLKRQLKLMNVEPFLHFTLKELKDLGITGEDVYIKLYFDEFIRRFELEDGSIAMYDEKKIKDKLIKYINEKNIDYDKTEGSANTHTE